MRKLTCLLSLMVLNCLAVPAQDYLVKTNGDSLSGKLSFAENSLGNEYVTIKVGKKKVSVKLLETRVIQTKKGELIKPVEFNGNYRFGKLISQGYLSYYKVSNDKTQEMFTDDLLTKMDGSALLIAGSIGFRNRVSNFLKDCYEVSLAVSQKRYPRAKLAQLVNDYNKCVEENGLMTQTEIAQRAELLRLAKQNKKANAISKSLEEKLSNFIRLLESSDKIAAKQDITAMFNDVAGKLRRKESVPQYLKTALEDGLKNDPQLKKLLAELLAEN